MLFTLTTLKCGVWHLAQGRIEYWSKNVFFHARMTPSQSLMVADGALKLNYASVIFVDPGVQIDETWAIHRPRTDLAGLTMHYGL